MTVLARTTDNITSHLAAEQLEASGQADVQRQRCLAEVVKNPGKTAAEIAVATGLERHVPSRRLPELRKIGLVCNGNDRVCTVKGSLMMTWWPL